MDRRIKNKFRLFILVIIVIVYLVVTYLNNNVEIKPNEDADVVQLYKCIDGDTAWFQKDKSVYKVRFLAINSPESNEKVEYYGKEASSYTCKMLKQANTIKLEKDEKSKEKDRYDRYLMWVFVDDILLQEDLVRNGYAEVKYIKGDYKYLDRLYAAQDIAKMQNKGMWSKND